MKASKLAAFAAGAYFFIAFVKDGTLEGLINDGTRASKRVLRSGQKIVKKTV